MDVTSSASERDEQLLVAAQELLLEGRTLDISLADVAERVGVSRSLVYVYFDGVPAMIDVLFQRQLGALEKRLSSGADDDLPFPEYALSAAAGYLDHLIETGPVLHLIVREHHQDSPLGSASRQEFRALLRMLAGRVRAGLDLSVREAFVLLELASAIPEALARLVRNGDIDRETAHATCRRLVSASVKAFVVTPAG